MAIEIKDRCNPEPPDGYYYCEACGGHVHHDDAVRDEEGSTYHEGCAKCCLGCDVVFLVTELVKGYCKKCREADPDE